MKIIHPSGQAYDLNIDTELELTRYNPFFHDKGEQSIPISLPATDHNLALLQHPESTAGKQKIVQRLDATIQSGIYSVNARQAILSARKNDSIETSFYLREGAFYEKTKDISLQEIFEDKALEFANIEAAINFMRSIIITDDERFTCFEVRTDKNRLNRIIASPSSGISFHNETPKIEIIDDKEISIPKGFYITPFIKVRYILQNVLSYLGYSLAPSFLDSTPFKDMCFLNNNIDSIVDSRIDFISLIPNLKVNELFSILRKFNIEFVPDEQKKIVYLLSFNDLLKSETKQSLDNSLVGNLKVNYAEYKQVHLSSNTMEVPESISSPDILVDHNRELYESYESKMPQYDKTEIPLKHLISQYPTCYLRKRDGAILRDGLKADRFVSENLGSLSMNYTSETDLEVIDKRFPDTTPALFTAPNILSHIIDHVVVTPYVGQGRSLYSSIIMSNELIESQDEGAVVAGSDTEKLPPMLCFNYRDTQGNGGLLGTTTNIDYKGNKLWDYTLMYHGEYGIYEKFWRNYDNLHRNALLMVEADLLLSEQQKASLSTVEKFILDGQVYLLSEMKYIPGEKTIGSCSLLTTDMQLPLNATTPQLDLFENRKYKWRMAPVQKSWTASGPMELYKTYRLTQDVTTFYPPHPTHSQYIAGGRYHQKIYNVEYGTINKATDEFTKLGDGTITVWLEAVLV